MLLLEMMGVLAFACAGVKHAGILGQSTRERGHSVVDGSFEVQNMTAERFRQPLLEGLIRQRLQRASIMMVEPAPHAASRMVNGREPTTMPK